jgi:hypothetical protein
MEPGAGGGRVAGSLKGSNWKTPGSERAHLTEVISLGVVVLLRWTLFEGDCFQMVKSYSDQQWERRPFVLNR